MPFTILFVAVTNMENRANKAIVLIEKKDNTYLLRCKGEWTLNNIADITSAIKKVSPTMDQQSNVDWDISAVEEFDSSGIILLLHHVKKFKGQMNNVNIIGANSAQEKMLMMFRDKVVSTVPMLLIMRTITNEYETI